MLRVRPWIAIFTLLLSASALHAQSGPSLLLKPWPQEGTFEVSADTLWFERSDLDDSELSFRLTTYESSGRFRLFPGNIASPRIGFDYYHLDIDTRDGRFPEDLVDASLAAGVFVAKFEGWIAGLTVGAGYAGADSFDDSNAWYGKSTLIFGKEFTDKSALVIALDYDGNRTVLPDVPLPGIGYQFKLPDRSLQFIIGFPVNAVTWEPNERFRAELTYAFSNRLDARVDYKFNKSFGVFSRFETRYTAFHLDNIEEENDRLFFEQYRAEAGLLWSPHKNVSLLAAGGYAFGQRFRTGWDARDLDTLDEIDDTPYARVGLEVRY